MVIKLFASNYARDLVYIFGSDYMKIFISTKENHDQARFKVYMLRMRARL
jgi:hypothetical protein